MESLESSDVFLLKALLDEGAQPGNPGYRQLEGVGQVVR